MLSVMNLSAAQGAMELEGSMDVFKFPQSVHIETGLDMCTLKAQIVHNIL